MKSFEVATVFYQRRVIVCCKFSGFVILINACRNVISGSLLSCVLCKWASQQVSREERNSRNERKKRDRER